MMALVMSGGVVVVEVVGWLDWLQRQAKIKSKRKKVLFSFLLRDPTTVFLIIAWSLVLLPSSS